MVLGAFSERSVCAYMDYGTIGSVDKEMHLKNWDEIFTCMFQASMRLRLSKCRFGVHDEEFLGHRVTKEGLRSSEGHTEAIRNFQKPTNVTGLLRFLKLMNYFAIFTPDFTNKARPLYEMLQGRGFSKKKNVAQSAESATGQTNGEIFRKPHEVISKLNYQARKFWLRPIPASVKF